MRLGLLSCSLRDLLDTLEGDQLGNHRMLDNRVD
jgi:hypothetical protein